MGRGKKKTKNPEGGASETGADAGSQPTSSRSELSQLGDSRPSTSRSEPSQPPDATEEVVKAMASTTLEPKKEEEKEEVIGLGLGGKKRRPRKKKTSGGDHQGGDTAETTPRPESPLQKSEVPQAKTSFPSLVSPKGRPYSGAPPEPMQPQLRPGGGGQTSSWGQQQQMQPPGQGPPPGWRQQQQMPTPGQGPPPGFGQQLQMPPPRQAPPPSWGQQQQMPTPGQGPPPGWGQQQQMPPTGQASPPGWGQQQQMPPTGQASPPGWGQQQQMPPPGQAPPPSWGQQQQVPRPAQGPPSFLGKQEPGPEAMRQQSVGRGRGVPASPRPQAAPQGSGAPKGRGSPQQVSTPAPVVQPAAQTQIVPAGDLRVPAKIPGRLRGRMTEVLTNYLPMEFQPIKIYRYDVLAKPDKPKKLMPQAFQIFMKKNFPKHWNKVAYDQVKNFYCRTPLPNVNDTSRVGEVIKFKDPNDKEVTFDISIKATGFVDLSHIVAYMKNGTSLHPPTEAIQCVDVILRQGTLNNYVKAGRCFFKRPDRPQDLGDGLELWTGLFQSAIFTSSAYVNIDVAHKGFPRQQPVMDLLDVFGLDSREPVTQSRNRYSLEQFKLFIKGIRVLCPVGGDSRQKREYIVNDIVDSADRQMFNITDPKGKELPISVANYFANMKQLRLRNPRMNCLWVGPKDKNIFYPMELCEVAPNQVMNKQLNEKQLRIMVKTAATPPHERKAKIDSIIQHMQYPTNPYFHEFGLRISDQFTKVPAKVLDPPGISYGDREERPRNGQWNSGKMKQCSSMDYWGVIAIGIDERMANMEELIKLFKMVGPRMGINVATPTFRRANVQTRDLSRLMQDVKAQLQLLVVVVPSRGDCYAAVKKTAEREVGLLTQCIRQETVSRRLNPKTVENILLKVNSKLMGVNQLISRSSLPECLACGGVMVVGADVTHPSPEQTSIPSIAAVTASIDDHCYSYNIGLSIQTPKKEMIVEFEDIMVEHLKVYKQRSPNKRLPQKIYVFRDGVSEGQFNQVLQSELPAVYNAWARLNGGQGKPQVLFLLVQKRHHTRLFQPGQNARFNVSPGTVVDSKIVHARELDFYLVSHQAILGTARPTRYHAIRNDMQATDDEVEQLTFYLCHLYSRCPRSVSYPTPTYYAHLACLRARCLTKDEKFNNAELEKKPRRLRILDDMLRTNPMFFV